jgi:hypothetical protein
VLPFRAKCVRPALAAAAFLFTVKTAAAQDPIVLTAKVVATEFLSAATAGNWATVIRLTDGQSLWEYVTLQRQQYRDQRPVQSEPMTVERYMKSDSTMPRAVAEWHLRQYEKAGRDTTPMLAWTFADVTSVAQIDSLSDEELYVRRLRAKQLSYLMDRVLTMSGCKPPFPPIPTPTRHVRGVALISDTEAIALYEERNDTFNLRDIGSGYEQLELRRTARGWRIVASEHVFGLGQAAAIGTDGNCNTTTPPP